MIQCSSHDPFQHLLMAQNSFWRDRSFLLRLADLTDAAVVKAFICCIFEPFTAQIGRVPRSMLADYRQVIQRDRVWVVEEGGDLIAVLVLGRKSAHYHIKSLAVRPDCQGKGMGHALLHHAEEQSMAAGYREIWLHTGVTMPRNIQLYSSLGYRAMYREIYQGSESIYMRKEIGE